MSFRAGLLALPLILALGACQQQDNAKDKIVPKAGTKAGPSADPIVVPEGETLGTPMAERVATLGLLNKRNGQTREVELKPGESIRIGKVVIRLRACEKTAPWETYPDEGAFVQLIIMQRPPGTTEAERWMQVFSGWLFKENPGANVVQHPIYDVWVKQCKMSFPGEEAPVESDSASEPKSKSSAPQSPAPARAAPEADNSGEAEEAIET